MVFQSSHASGLLTKRDAQIIACTVGWKKETVPTWARFSTKLVEVTTFREKVGIVSELATVSPKVVGICDHPKARRKSFRSWEHSVIPSIICMCIKVVDSSIGFGTATIGVAYLIDWRMLSLGRVRRNNGFRKNLGKSGGSSEMVIVLLTQYKDWFSTNEVVLNLAGVSRRSSYRVLGWKFCGP